MRAVLSTAAMLVLALVLATSGAMAGVVISINKSSQRMSVTVDGVPKYLWPVSTGVNGYTTPSGSFTPFRMEKDHFSEEWDDAPMPNSIFFTQEGHAIHGSFSSRIGQRASHGCVRLAPQNAALLFALVESKGLYNTRILISDDVAVASAFGKKGKKFVKKIYRNPLGI